MIANFKKTGLAIAKITGLFELAAMMTHSKLRILCYHGFSFGDQSSFRPKLYINTHTFKTRIDYLKKKRFQFLAHNDIENFFDGKTMHNIPVLLTIDDGWKSTHELAFPVLKEHDVPHIIYLYTDYHERNAPVLNVLLQYGLWKTHLEQIYWDGESFNLKSEADKSALLDLLLSQTYPLEKDNLNEKLSEIFRALDVEYAQDKEWKHFSLLNEPEVKEHVSQGASIQLHTHHHVNPLEDDLLMEELKENRRIIESVTGQPAEHFCYPSGVFSKDNFPLLKKMGIKSAVTCEPGLNDKNTHPYELKRFLDGENISQLEFEAEMSGFLEICRRIFRRGH